MSLNRQSALIYWLTIPLVSLALLPGLASGADSLMSASDRTGKWEFNLTSQYIDSGSVSFENNTSADLNDTIGWGFGIGYNFSEKLEFNFDMNWSNVSYRANYLDENDNPQTLGSTLYGSSANLALTYNFMPKRFTPFITGTIGWSYIDSSIPSGPPIDGCWWYPWWGYICGPYQPTYTANNFTYGALAGLRFDLGRSMYLKGSLGKQYLDTEHGGTYSTTLYRLNLGWMFR